MKELNNKDLIEGLKKLKGRENQIIAELIRYLCEVDRRKLYLELGYPSLFAYCCKALKYSESAAYRRIAAARVYRDNPEVYHKLIGGELTLCAVAELAKVISPKNKVELFSKIEGKSKQEVQSVVAEYRAPETGSKRQESVRVRQVKRRPVPLLVSQAPRTEEPHAKSYTVTIELSEEEMAVVQEAQTILSTAKVRETLLQSARKVVQHHKSLRVKREHRAANKGIVKESLPPTFAKATAGKPVEADNGRSRYISADVRHAVEMRDGGRCSYVATDGTRCCETKNLEFDHRAPYALGGKSDANNLRLLCRGHNKLFAEQVFGREMIQNIIDFRRQTTVQSVSGIETYQHQAPAN